MKTEEYLWKGACEIAGGDPVQAIHNLRGDNARLREALIRRHKEQCYPMPEYMREALNMSNGKKIHE
jgi:hypothetical protein